MPGKARHYRASAHGDAVRKMEIGESFVLPHNRKGGLSCIASQSRKKLAVRLLDTDELTKLGLTEPHVRVWRVA